MARDEKQAAKFLLEAQDLVRSGWRCCVDLNKPKNRDYADFIGVPYNLIHSEAANCLLDLSNTNFHDGPTNVKNRKSLDHDYEFNGLHKGKRVFLRLRIDRDRQVIYFNSFHDDTEHLFLRQGKYR